MSVVGGIRFVRLRKLARCIIVIIVESQSHLLDIVSLNSQVQKTQGRTRRSSGCYTCRFRDTGCGMRGLLGGGKEIKL